MTNQRHMAILQISSEALCELLQLPQDVVILGFQADFVHHNLLEIKIDGAGWPTREGQVLARTRGIITKEFDASGAEVGRSIDWRLPTYAKEESGT